MDGSRCSIRRCRFRRGHPEHRHRRRGFGRRGQGHPGLCRSVEALKHLNMHPLFFVMITVAICAGAAAPPPAAWAWPLTPLKDTYAALGATMPQVHRIAAIAARYAGHSAPSGRADHAAGYLQDDPQGSLFRHHGDPDHHSLHRLLPVHRPVCHGPLLIYPLGRTETNPNRLQRSGAPQGAGSFYLWEKFRHILRWEGHILACVDLIGRRGEHAREAGEP